MANRKQYNEDLKDIASLWYSQNPGQTPNLMDVAKLRQIQDKKKMVSGFSNLSTQRIARGLLEAEHRGTNPEFNKSDMFIRTKHRKAPGGSSAFGPGQITMNTAKDILARGNLSPEARKYVKERFIPAGRAMLRHGNEGPGRGGKPWFDPIYDYGGQAGLNVESEYPLYNELWAATIEQKLKDARVTSKDVLKDKASQNEFLSRYYSKNREPAYDASFIEGTQKLRGSNMLDALKDTMRLQRMSPKPRWAE